MRSWLVLVLAALAGCHTTPQATTPTVPGAIADRGETVGTVNGTPMGAKELGLVFERMRVPPDQIPGFENTSRGRHVAEEYAYATALYQQAVDSKLYEDPEVQMQLAFAARQVLGQAMRDKLAKEKVDDAAIQAWYEQNKARFDKPEVQARQIVVATETEAKDLMDRLAKGEDFAALAKAHSIDKASAARGGELGWFKPTELATIGDQVAAAPVGTRLGPLETRLGFQIVDVEGKRDSTPLEDVKAEAKAQLEHAEAIRLMEDLRKSTKIEWVKPLEGGDAADGAGGALPPGHPVPPSPAAPAAPPPGTNP